MNEGKARPLVRRLLTRHESLRLKPYDDKTGRPVPPGGTLIGKLTIGVGRNLTDRGITREEADRFLDTDLDVALEDLRRFVSGVDSLDPVRLAALWDWSFNLGAVKLAQFERQTLPAIRRRDWIEAARLLRRSAWASQVGTRAERLIVMIETGREPVDL